MLATVLSSASPFQTLTTLELLGNAIGVDGEAALEAAMANDAVAQSGMEVLFRPPVVKN